MWHIVLFLFTLITTVYSQEVSIKKRVCIIGAGPAGLSAAKQFSKPKDFEIVVFEKNSDIGGQWLYTEKSGIDNHGLPVHSGIYKYMRTNFPKELMAFPDYQEFHGENGSFVTHETAMEYLKNYTDHFNIRHFIQFDTVVEKVHFKSNWIITIRNLNTQARNEISCEAVMICIGNVFKPLVPEIPGIESFPGKVLHSHDYRKPEDFSNQTVALLGAGLSGIDIGIEISRYAHTIYLSHRNDKLNVKLPVNLIQVPGIVAVNNSQLILSNGSTIIVDTFIFCTGYVYDYPFLDSSSGIIVDDGKHVHPLYKHFINIDHPTMAILDIPYPGLPFQFSYVQAKYFLAVLQGKIKLPDRTKMMEESALAANISTKKAHFISNQTAIAYYKELAQVAQAEPLASFYEKAFILWVKDLIENPMYYKERNLRVYDDGRVELA